MTDVPFSSTGGPTDGLTFKSIETILAEHVRDGRLVPFKPAMDRDEVDTRRLYTTRRVAEFIRGNTEKVPRSPKYFGFVRASLSEFVKGNEIEDDELTIKRLKYDYGDPELSYTWEYKIAFNPHARLFGKFANFDALVLFTVEARANCAPDVFRGHMEGVRDEWRDFFGDLKPLRMPNLADCISNVI